MKISEKYLIGLKQAYIEVGGSEIWERLEKVKHGASAEDIQKLKEQYPEIPASLLDLLDFADGTHWRAYGDEKVNMRVLGTADSQEFGYHLLSVRQMLENQNLVKKHEIYWKSIDRRYDESDVKVDDRIISDSSSVSWLHFADIDYSQLFVDFTPSAKGKAGQIVKYIHDPDEFTVVADSFDDYLQILIDYEYIFVNEDAIKE
ncbi:MAG: SMI1/KNR4 family protein [Oscillospiraceae bacterium]|nr:SMI1/KNR4 family protein [Oscillospiraceae bacterium]